MERQRIKLKQRLITNNATWRVTSYSHAYWNRIGRFCYLGMKGIPHEVSYIIECMKNDYQENEPDDLVWTVYYDPNWFVISFIKNICFIVGSIFTRSIVNWNIKNG